MQSLYIVDIFPMKENKIASEFYIFSPWIFTTVKFWWYYYWDCQLKIQSVVHKNAKWTKNKARSSGLDKGITFVR